MRTRPVLGASLLLLPAAGCLGGDDHVETRGLAVAAAPIVPIAPPSCEPARDVPPGLSGLRTNPIVWGRTIAFALSGVGFTQLGFHDLGADGTLGGGDDGGEFLPSWPPNEALVEGPRLALNVVIFTTVEIVVFPIPQTITRIRMYDLGPDATAGTGDDSGLLTVDDSRLSGSFSSGCWLHGRFASWAGPVPFFCQTCPWRWCDTTIPLGQSLPGACEPGGWSVDSGTGMPGLDYAGRVVDFAGTPNFYWDRWSGASEDVWSRLGLFGTPQPAFAAPAAERYADTDLSGLLHVFVEYKGSTQWTGSHLRGAHHVLGPATPFDVTPGVVGTFDWEARMSPVPGATGETWIAWLRDTGSGNRPYAAIWDPNVAQAAEVLLDARGNSPSVYANEVVWAIARDASSPRGPLRYTRCWPD